MPWCIQSRAVGKGLDESTLNECLAHLCKLLLEEAWQQLQLALVPMSSCLGQSGGAICKKCKSVRLVVIGDHLYDFYRVGGYGE